MKNKKLRLLNYGLALLGLLGTACVYPSLPGKIPTHWNLDGSVTYSEKIGIWPLTGLLLLFAILFDVLPHLDPRKKNYQKFGNYYDSFCILMQVFLLLMLGITISESLAPGRIPVGRAVPAFLGLLFMFVGNLLPKVKSNFYFGIKTPWALSDEEIWKKTNRLGGKAMFFSGAIVFILSWLLKPGPLAFVLFSLLISASLLPGVMSYLWWRKKYSS